MLRGSSEDEMGAGTDLYNLTLDEEKKKKIVLLYSPWGTASTSGNFKMSFSCGTWLFAPGKQNWLLAYI